MNKREKDSVKRGKNGKTQAGRILTPSPKLMNDLRGQTFHLREPLLARSDPGFIEISSFFGNGVKMRPLVKGNREQERSSKYKGPGKRKNY
jgi:hypothetical protein